MKISRYPMPINTGSPDREGCLLFVDGSLVAVFVRLSVDHEQKLSGKWFLEHGFGPLASEEQELFEDLNAAERWALSRLS